MKNIISKKVATLIATFVLYTTTSVQAQLYAQVHEFGIGISDVFYKGSALRSPTLKELNPGISIFHRYNFNPVWVLRSQLSYLSLKYKDSDFDHPLNQFRTYAFNTDLYEFAMMAEYNFLDYRGSNRRITFTPYLMGGLAGIVSDANNGNQSTISASLPIGIGLKYNLGKEWNFGVEFIARKSFDDNLDGSTGLNNFNNLQLGEEGKSDWYYTIGISLSYTKYTINCPEYHPKN